MPTKATTKNTAAKAATEALAELDAAKALTARRKEELGAARITEAAARRALEEGDDSVSAADLSTLAGGIERSIMLLKAAKDAEVKARRMWDYAEACANPELGRAVLDIVEAHALDLGVHGVPVNLVSKLSREPAKSVHAELGQSVPGEHTAAGTINGRVLLAVHGPKETAQCVYSRLVSGVPEFLFQSGRVGKAEKSGGLGSIQHDDGSVRLTAYLALHGLRPEVPTLPKGEPAAHVLKGAVDSIAYDLRESIGQRKPRGVTIGGGDASAYVTTASGSAGHIEFRGERVEGDLTYRTLRAHFDMGVEGLGGSAVQDRGARWIERNVPGRFLAGIGRATDVNFVSIEAAARITRRVFVVDITAAYRVAQ